MIRWRTLPAGTWTAAAFPLAPEEMLDLLHRLAAEHSSLGRLSHFYRVRDCGINYNRATIARRSLYVADVPADPRDVPRFRGRDFDRFTTVRRGGWLRSDAEQMLQPGERFSLVWPIVRLPEKIVVRQTADSIIATLDRNRMAMGRSVIAVTAEADVSLPGFLAVLNSSLLTVLYRALSGEVGRLLPQVKVGRLRALPVPEVCATPVAGLRARHRTPGRVPTALDRAAVDSLFAWAWLDVLGRAMLEGEGRDASLGTLIDRVVCRLYGVSEEEAQAMEIHW